MVRRTFSRLLEYGRSYCTGNSVYTQFPREARKKLLRNSQVVCTVQQITAARAEHGTSLIMGSFSFPIWRELFYHKLVRTYIVDRSKKQQRLKAADQQSRDTNTHDTMRVSWIRQ